jgi:manganese transport protein
MSGQAVMKGFIRFEKVRLPDTLLRLITMLPAIIIIIFGINPMRVLVLSQVALSFILPAPILQMLHISGKEKYMGSFKNKRWVRTAGIVIAAVIIGLNASLLLITFTGLK